MTDKERQKALGHTFKNAWDVMSEEMVEATMALGEDYKLFLDNGKTERACAADIQKRAEARGYIDVEKVISGEVKPEPGLKFYANNRGKSIILFVLGKEPISSGMNIVGGHIDAPRLDLKPFPLYEDSDIAYLKTHYYGGIRKHQWTSLPLSLHGTVIDAEGKKLEVVIGEAEGDPVFFITDLLPHLAKDQNQKKLGEAITGEGLNIVIGNRPLGEDELKDRVKYRILDLLKESYGMTEEDFISAEFEVVPAGKARDVGLDRSMISAYGHDDRVCSYGAMAGIFDVENPERTAVGMFMDKEEVGSMGNTGSESKYFQYIVSELLALMEEGDVSLNYRRALHRTSVLSADVCAAFDPNYPEVSDKKNSGLMGYGVQLTKYTGVRGKGGSSDANAEFLGKVRKLFNDNDVVWQVGELGKVDQGGGGTIAYILANEGAEVIDCGVPMLSMHAPYELVSKADLYMTYKAYAAFFRSYR